MIFGKTFEPIKSAPGDSIYHYSGGYLEERFFFKIAISLFITYHISFNKVEHSWLFYCYETL